MGFTVFWIYTTLKLWYSFIITTSKFYCILNLHYSQTLSNQYTAGTAVLLYSEFTLLSNTVAGLAWGGWVLLYSEFTLLSNHWKHRWPVAKVLLYSEFILLSNVSPCYYNSVDRFTVFWIYTTLKPYSCFKGFAWAFYCILNLHYSQTGGTYCLGGTRFYCILNLHYSQTAKRFWQAVNLFYCILNLHYSQTLKEINMSSLKVLLYSEFTLLSNGLETPCFHLVVLLYSEFTLLSNRVIDVAIMD